MVLANNVHLNLSFLSFSREGIIYSTHNALSPPLKLPSATNAAIASSSEVKYALAVRATGMSKRAFLFGRRDS